MPEMHSRQPEFTYGDYGSFTKKKKNECNYLKKPEIHDIFLKTN